MTRKQLSEFSYDQLINLKYKYLGEIPGDAKRAYQIYRILKRINHELFTKKKNESDLKF
jgi:ERCC4-type nuclease